jgi:hypothetical protein
VPLLAVEDLHLEAVAGVQLVVLVDAHLVLAHAHLHAHPGCRARERGDGVLDVADVVDDDLHHEAVVDERGPPPDRRLKGRGNVEITATGNGDSEIEKLKKARFHLPDRRWGALPELQDRLHPGLDHPEEDAAHPEPDRQRQDRGARRGHRGRDGLEVRDEGSTPQFWKTSLERTKGRFG